MTKILKNNLLVLSKSGGSILNQYNFYTEYYTYERQSILIRKSLRIKKNIKLQLSYSYKRKYIRKKNYKYYCEKCYNFRAKNYCSKCKNYLIDEQDFNNDSLKKLSGSFLLQENNDFVHDKLEFKYITKQNGIMDFNNLSFSDKGLKMDDSSSNNSNKFCNYI